MRLDPQDLPFPAAYPLLHVQSTAEPVVTPVEVCLLAGDRARV